MAYCSDKDSCSWKDLYVFPTTILETVRARYPRPFSWVKDSTFIQTGLHSNGRLLWTRLWFVSFLIGPGISSLCVFLAWDVLDRFVHFSSHYFLRLQLNIMYFGWWTLFLHGHVKIWYSDTSLCNLSINPLKTKRRPLYLKTQSVPRCKHFSSRL